MGKRTRKTRWRTLAIGDEHSDSEESNSTLDTRIPPSYRQNYYNRFPYSSQSTPTRRYQSDSTKSTRSSSTASENKITFNEDEYTRITTPRQDVLFKKGYLNKPKNYQTQTSTGNSTTSTGNSTGNGTPDYQSTDLEYESQFVFPNGFLDQNGIYYVNSFDPYPLMVYNPPTYYAETCNKSKRCSTGSLTESTSPNNEENQNGGDAMNYIPSEYSHVYNMYPGFYYNGVCPPQELENGQCQPDSRRVKRRRRRKLSQSKTDQDGTTSEYTDDYDSSDGVHSEENDKTLTSHQHPSPITNGDTSHPDPSKPDSQMLLLNGISKEASPSEDDSSITAEDRLSPATDVETSATPSSSVTNEKCSNDRVSVDDDVVSCETCSDSNHQSETNAELCSKNSPGEDVTDPKHDDQTRKYDLKPDAQEFVPRYFRTEYAHHHNHNLQFVKIPPNYVPILGPGHNHMNLIPHAIPLNMLPQDPKLYTNFVNYNNHYMQKSNPTITEIVNDKHHTQVPTIVEEGNDKTIKDIDLAKIVSKLEAVKEQETCLEEKPETNVEDLPDKSTNEPKEAPSNINIPSNTEKRYGPLQKRDRRLRQNVVRQPYINKHTEMISTDNEVGDTDQNVVQNDNQHKVENQQPKDTNSNLNTTNGEVRRKWSKYETNQPLRIDGHNNGLSPRRRFYDTNTYRERKNQLSDSNNHHWKLQTQFNGSPRRVPCGTPSKTNDIISAKGKDHVPTSQFSDNYSTTKPTDPNDRAKDYSQTLKKTQKLPQNRLSDRPENEPKIIKTPKSNTNSPPPIPSSADKSTSSTLWIPVSNRKKRKNRNVEELETFDLEEPQTEQIDDKFESYDVKLLVDVVPSGDEKSGVLDVAETLPVTRGKDEEDDRNVLSSVQEEISKIAVSVHETNVERCCIEIPEVREIEKALLQAESLNASEGVKLSEDSPKSSTESTDDFKMKVTKRKSKKGNQKPSTKRVFVTDVYLCPEQPKVKCDHSVERVKLSNVENTGEVIDQRVTKEVVKDEVPTEKAKIEPLEEMDEVKKPDVKREDPIVNGVEKKIKKKKNKTKLNSVNSVSSSSTTLNHLDDSYDFLLDASFSGDAHEKTNVEISQELDLMIQKGMYNSLEEKIKSIDIAPPKDDFFESVLQNISRMSRESSVDTNHDFSKLINALPRFKSSMASIEDDQTVGTSLLDLNKPSTSKNGIFVENPEITVLLNDIYERQTTENKSEAPMISDKTADSKTIENNEDFRREASMESQPIEKLYPITQAVKNWMSRTRENTPEVEFWKSPNTIYKELYENEVKRSISEDEPPNAESDEEVTIYTANHDEIDDQSRKSSLEQDLLECWEHEIPIEPVETKTDAVDARIIQNGCAKESLDEGAEKLVENGEDVLEVYESNYGQNADYLKLKSEAENQRATRNFPKHGTLPYRAICCSIM